MTAMLIWIRKIFPMDSSQPQTCRKFAHGQVRLPGGLGRAGLWEPDADAGAAGGVWGELPEVFVPVAGGWGWE